VDVAPNLAQNRVLNHDRMMDLEETLEMEEDLDGMNLVPKAVDVPPVTLVDAVDLETMTTTERTEDSPIGTMVARVTTTVLGISSVTWITTDVATTMTMERMRATSPMTTCWKPMPSNMERQMAAGRGLERVAPNHTMDLEVAPKAIRAVVVEVKEVRRVAPRVDPSLVRTMVPMEDQRDTKAGRVVPSRDLDHMMVIRN